MAVPQRPSDNTPQGTTNGDSTEDSRDSFLAELAQSAPASAERRFAPAVLADNSQFPTEHNKLDSAAAQVFDQKELKRFRQNMDTFEQRVVQKGLDQSEVGKTYEAIERLLSADPAAPVKIKDRMMLAQQILDQAAKPSEIDQGQHQTCSVTVVETRLYNRMPSAAAKVVADIATGGKFVTKDGTTVALDAKTMEPDDEARSKNTPDRWRSFASQLFQATAVNVHWNRQIISPTGEFVPKGSIHYEQHNNLRNRSDRGERLYDYSTNPPKQVGTQPRLGVSHLTDISNQITGLSESGFVIENEKRARPFTITIRSEQELKNALVNAQRDGRFPVVLRVHSGQDPFSSMSSESGVWHAVTITDIDQAKGKVMIDNQWGRQSDRWVSFSTLYKATLQPGDKDKADMLPPILNEHRGPAILHEKN